MPCRGLWRGITLPPFRMVGMVWAYRRHLLERENEGNTLEVPPAGMAAPATHGWWGQFRHFIPTFREWNMLDVAYRSFPRGRTSPLPAQAYFPASLHP